MMKESLWNDAEKYCKIFEDSFALETPYFMPLLEKAKAGSVADVCKLGQQFLRNTLPVEAKEEKAAAIKIGLDIMEASLAEVVKKFKEANGCYFVDCEMFVGLYAFYTPSEVVVTNPYCGVRAAADFGADAERAKKLLSTILKVSPIDLYANAYTLAYANFEKDEDKIILQAKKFLDMLIFYNPIYFDDFNFKLGIVLDSLDVLKGNKANEEEIAGLLYMINIAIKKYSKSADFKGISEVNTRRIDAMK